MTDGFSDIPPGVPPLYVLDLKRYPFRSISISAWIGGATRVQREYALRYNRAILEFLAVEGHRS